MSSNTWTQDKINDLLQSSQDVDYPNSRLTPNIVLHPVTNVKALKQTKPQRKENMSENYDDEHFESLSITHKNQKQSNCEYGQQEFDSYEESRKTFKANQHQVNKPSSSHPPQAVRNNAQRKSGPPSKNQKQLVQANKLTAIQEQQLGTNSSPFVRKSANSKDINKNSTTNGFQKIDLNMTHPKRSTSFKKSINLTSGNIKVGQQHLPHNYAKLHQRQRQLLFTRITQQNKMLREQIMVSEKQKKSVQFQYNMLVKQKAKTSVTVRQKALEQQVINLKNKVQKLTNLKILKQKTATSITHLSKTQQKFIPQQQLVRREHQLLVIIDKLKERLLQLQNQLVSVQPKLNYTEELQRKLKRVQQLQYRIQKMTDQAETDRLYIQTLKESIKQLQKKVHEEKNRAIKLQVVARRSELAGITGLDLANQLKDTRRQKQQLEKALKNLSSTIMGNVVRNFQNNKKGHHTYNDIQDSEQILTTNAK